MVKIVDSAGNLYIADSFNSRIRKVSAAGVITTVAGSGKAGFSGDGGPATVASLNGPNGVVVDSAGNLYIADTGNNRVRKVSTAGTIATVAGSGVLGFSGDGGQATAASLYGPYGVAVDSAGNLYVGDASNERIREISTAGIITTIVGNGKFGFSGDGGPALAAPLNLPLGVAVDSAGNLYIADHDNNRIREVLAAPPIMSASPLTLSFAGLAGGAPAPSQSLVVLATVPYVPFTVYATTSDGANWLSVDTASGSTPKSMQITADPTMLTTSGSYSGQITIQSSFASGSPITISVAFNVGPGVPPALAVDQTNLTFTFPAGASANSQAVRVRNAGGGTLNFTVTPSPNAPWLSVTPASAAATPALPVTLAVTADPSGLSPGAYSGGFTVVGSDSSVVTVPVTMNVSANSSALLLSQAYDDLIENNRRRIALLEESARLLYQEWFVRLRFPGHEHARIAGGEPVGWRRLKLGAITTKIGSGATPRGGSASYQGSGITLIRSLNVYNDRFDDDGLAFINEEQAEALANVTVESRDILLNITGASVARCCMAPDRYLPARVNQHVMILRPDPEKADPLFVHAALNSDERKRQLLSYAQKGSTREALTKEMMAEFEIMLPSNVLMRQFGELAETCFRQRENVALQNQRLKAARDLLLPRLMSGEIAF